MNTRLSSLLVAGGVVLAGIQVAAAPLPGAENPDSKVSASSENRSSTLLGAAMDSDSPSAAKVLLQVPGYAQQPRLQVLSGPWRVVVDLPGVTKAMKFGKAEARAFSHPLIQAARIAQFSASPNAITRVVLEVVPGTQVEVARGTAGILLNLAQGEGSVQARLGVAGVQPIQPPPASAAVPAIETEIVTAQAVSTTVVPPDSQLKPLALVELPVSSVAAAIKSIPELQSVPAIGASYRPLPTLVGSALLPMTLGETRQQEPPPAADSKAAQGTGGARVLGDSTSKYTGSRLSIDIHSASVMTFLMILADHAHLNLVADPEVETLTGSFKFTETPWDLILDMVLKHHGLGKEIDHGVIRVAKLEKLQKEEEDRKKLEEAKALAGEIQSITRPLSYAKAGEVKGIIKEMLTKRGNVIIDDRTNTLIITDLTRNLGLIDDLIAQLDIAIQQVQIEAKVVEANQGYQKAFGVKWPTANGGGANLTVGGSDAAWGATNSPSWNSINNRPGAGQNSTLLAFAPGKDNVTSIPSPAGEFWISFLSNRVSINAILQGLESDGIVKIVSSPKLVTQNNKKGKILSGEKIPYPAIQASGGGGTGAITVQFAEANLELDVTPQITSDGTVMMDLNIKKAEADFTRTVNGTPTIVTKEVQTMVLVKDGGTAILGGVYITNNQSGSTGVPFLSKLPILGWLFRNKTQQDSNKELLIFITPRIIRN
jgi:type IV pilus assembly protein PilQ